MSGTLREKREYAPHNVKQLSPWLESALMMGVRGPHSVIVLDSPTSLRPGGGALVITLRGLGQYALGLSTVPFDPAEEIGGFPNDANAGS